MKAKSLYIDRRRYVFMLNAARWILGYLAYSTLCLMTIIVTFNGCSTGRGGKDTLCTVQGGPEPHQHTVTCPDGSTSTIEDGQRGEVGSTGQSGATGIVGPMGPQGLPGVAGTDALPCSTSPVTGGIEVSCPDGSTSTVLDGVDGQDGAPGTLIETVSFCPNQGPTVYPSYFPEYGLKITGVIYAVYFGHTQGSPNANTAFLAQIPPGAYKSTGGYACNFTVNTDGSITQN